MSTEAQVKSKLIPIIKQKTIDGLIGVFDMIINDNPDLSEFHLEKTMNFINDLNGIRSEFTEEEKEYDEKFNNDSYLVDLLKKNIMNLYSTRKNDHAANFNIKGYKND